MMARSLNSQCDFKNGLFTCNLPKDTVLLILKVKTKKGNHTLVEDTEKQTEKFHPGKKQAKDGNETSFFLYYCMSSILKQVLCV